MTRVHGWARIEWLLLTAVLSAWVLAQRAEVDWPRFVMAFVAIDLVGYLPGAVAHHRAAGRRIRPLYYRLYNLTHNFVTGAALVAAWSLATGGLEWAMLAVPLHLTGDRGVFGNAFKSADRPFEARPGPVAP